MRVTKRNIKPWKYENEFGVDLGVLKAARKGFYSKYFNSYVKPFRIVIFEVSTRPYIEVYRNKMTKLIFIGDYGKTWALTEEELQRDTSKDIEVKDEVEE
jgi:hypothetical protein